MKKWHDLYGSGLHGSRLYYSERTVRNSSNTFLFLKETILTIAVVSELSFTRYHIGSKC